MTYKKKRSRGRKDSNQKEIEEYAKERGFAVIDVSGLPSAGCDMIVLGNGVHVVEVKRPGCENDLTDNETETRLRCLQAGVPYNVISDKLQFCAMVGIPYIMQDKCLEFAN